MRHLRHTGLIYHCFQTDNGYWRIPYHVAAEIASPEALSLRQKEAPRHRPKEESDELWRLKAHLAEAEMVSRGKPTPQRPKTRVEILTQPRDDNNLPQYYRQIGKVLQDAGVTLKDMLHGLPLRGKPDDDTVMADQARGKADGGDDDDA
jgi:hypothetical protein